jgi:hypothetical protein
MLCYHAQSLGCENWCQVGITEVGSLYRTVMEHAFALRAKALRRCELERPGSYGIKRTWTVESFVLVAVKSTSEVRPCHGTVDTDGVCKEGEKKLPTRSHQEPRSSHTWNPTREELDSIASGR